MLRAKTTFIIGAGASCEVGLPLGSELKSIIARELDIRYDDYGTTLTSGSYQIVQALYQHIKDSGITPPNINPFLSESWAIRDAMPQSISIDNFLDAHKYNDKIELCGKLAIVNSILSAEKNSYLYAEPGSKVNFFRLENTWFPEFFKLLSEGVSKEACAHIFDNVSFIVFNYDRCFEHFLINALSNYYRITPDETSQLVNKACILHPYGVVGKLPWQQPGAGSIDFGGQAQGTSLLSIAKQIKTFTEQIESKDILKKIKDEIELSDALIFLGFGYGEQNLELLKPSSPSKTKKIFGTCKGVSHHDKAIVISQLKGILKNYSTQTLELNDAGCYEFFKIFWRGLSAPV